jgi:2-dehydro-3-deoxyphosphogluconate aldolase / (4S)-4-hydroxy-2-oxoglutarate aldolase
MRLADALHACPVVAILRASTAKRFGEVSDVLTSAGIRAVEFTFTTPDVLDALAAYAERKPDDVALGAGTVTTADEARAAVDAGASYLVSPALCLDVIETGNRLGVPVLPGAFTPTEILTAWRAGAAMVKVFPISVGGTAYIQALRGPLPDIPLVPTGGVDLGNANAYLAAGATAIGMGSPLLRTACEPEGDLELLAERAKGLVTSLRGRRSR